MQTEDFYFDLPENLIAQSPLEKRDASKMLILNKENGNTEHDFFYNICDYLERNDVLVINNSKVLPARLISDKDDIEFLLLEQIQRNTWEIICKPGKKVKEGRKFSFSNGKINAEVMEVLENGNRLVEFEYKGNFFALLDQIGQMPLPPYITEKLEDSGRYQTVYANPLGSAAAPTAGLHFTADTFAKLRKKGVITAPITLHVGLGTFRPVKVSNPEEHTMHSEYYEIPAESLEKIKKARRVIAVGTTSARTLESYAETGQLSGKTNIFIYPPYEFKLVDVLLTNFHLPESTLIMLVSAFAGYENTMEAYKTAIRENYRFFSFGDCMLIN